MKTDIIGVIIALILTFVSVLSVCAQDAKVSEVRKVEVFSSIEITSVGTVYFTQSDTYSFRIEGKEKYVKNTETTVKDGCLLIGFKDRKNKSLRNQQDGVTIWISAPDLKEVEFTGVGQFNCEKPLKLDEVSFEVKGVGEVNVSDLTCNELKVALRGVGSADIHVTCDYLTAKMSGVGDVTLSGTAGHADISKGGIGGVNTDNLKIGR
ncbi:GIN domain-containing protein [Bacteroides rodentium]